MNRLRVFCVICCGCRAVGKKEEGVYIYIYILFIYIFNWGIHFATAEKAPEQGCIPCWRLPLRAGAAGAFGRCTAL
jgi:hypothetical protein